jgi:hypothetical protein
MMGSDTISKKNQGTVYVLKYVMPSSEGLC